MSRSSRPWSGSGRSFGASKKGGGKVACPLQWLRLRCKWSPRQREARRRRFRLRQVAPCLVTPALVRPWQLLPRKRGRPLLHRAHCVSDAAARWIRSSSSVPQLVLPPLAQAAVGAMPRPELRQCPRRCPRRSGKAKTCGRLCSERSRSTQRCCSHPSQRWRQLRRRRDGWGGGRPPGPEWQLAGGGVERPHQAEGRGNAHRGACGRARRRRRPREQRGPGVENGGLQSKSPALSPRRRLRRAASRR
mmetsp:Transcript_111738/g.249374  ORF Transcript_111738/g.249374 Transcript_111738/m.249374 type:complete len:247 (-) Transcript_111738:930-1670(-)